MVYCAGCRRKGHVLKQYPCRHIHRVAEPAKDSESEGDESTKLKKKPCGRDRISRMYALIPVP